jgi:FAD synthase
MLQFYQYKHTKEKKMTVHEQLVQLFDTYVTENQKFTEKGVKVSASRARKALAEIAKLCKDRRKEIQDIKNEG